MFGALKELREIPIPKMDEYHQKRLGYREHRINLENEQIDEPLINVHELGIAGENYYFRVDNPPYYQRIPHSIPDLKLRKSVVDRLARANEKLARIGLELYLFDGYRPIEVQNYFYDHWFPNYLKSIHPELEGDMLEAEVAKYWAKGAKSSSEIDPLSPPPHSTGGAVDLTIRRKSTGEHLYMGSLFDDVTEIAHCDFLEKVSEQRILNFSEDEALKNRRLLHWLLMEQEFSFNPAEWWHFSYGDQLWARLGERDAAIYSFAGYTKP